MGLEGINPPAAKDGPTAAEEGSSARGGNMKVRRVVTGHTADGKATIASDMEVEAITLSAFDIGEFHRLWGADAPPTFPDGGSPRPMWSYFPPVGGFRFGLFSVPPEQPGTPDPVDLEKGLREMEEKLPGLLPVLEPDNPGMHTTNTIDFEYVISGEVWLELDDGVQVHLHPGDTVVQNGTRHAWRNKGSEPCRMVVCLIGARRP